MVGLVDDRRLHPAVHHQARLARTRHHLGRMFRVACEAREIFFGGDAFGEASLHAAVPSDVTLPGPVGAVVILYAPAPPDARGGSPGDDHHGGYVRTELLCCLKAGEPSIRLAWGGAGKIAHLRAAAHERFRRVQAPVRMEPILLAGKSQHGDGMERVRVGHFGIGEAAQGCPCFYGEAFLRPDDDPAALVRLADGHRAIRKRNLAFRATALLDGKRRRALGQRRLPVESCRLTFAPRRVKIVPALLASEDRTRQHEWHQQSDPLPKVRPHQIR